VQSEGTLIGRSAHVGGVTGRFELATLTAPGTLDRPVSVPVAVNVAGDATGCIRQDSAHSWDAIVCGAARSRY
jgi:hypothetical protein